MSLSTEVATHPAERGAHPGRRPRLLWLDASRTMALGAMIVFHFARDLEIFGALPPGTTLTGGWAVLAHTVAGTFLFLSGISLVVAHEARFRFGAWIRRLLIVSGAAALVTIATYLVLPDKFVYFGILHVIAASSLAGGGLLRASAWVLVALALAILALDNLLVAGILASPWLAWTGLGATVPPSLDFLPMIPWFAAFLVGMACAKALPVSEHDLPIGFITIARRLTWPGRHSLKIYLVHQPLLLALLWVTTVLFR